MDDDEDGLGWVPGCDCPSCAAARVMFNEKLAAKEKPKASKPKLQTLPANGEINLRDIVMPKRADSKALKSALLLMSEHLEEARSSTKVSQFILVGGKDTLPTLRLNVICHACLTSDIAFRTGQVRYLAQFSNHQLKPQYHKEDGDQEPFEGARLAACQAYWLWLRNESHWSRFFAGPSDVSFLTDYGCILDLKAPSVAAHFAAVAWRMPGEYIELVETWHMLVAMGFDPHISLALAMTTSGYGGTDAIEVIHSAGHMLLPIVDIEVMARIYTGCVKLGSASCLTSACDRYSTYTDKCYGAGYDIKNWTNDALSVDGLTKKTFHKDMWDPAGPMRERAALNPVAFASPDAPGMLWLMGAVEEFVVTNNLVR